MYERYLRAKNYWYYKTLLRVRDFAQGNKVSDTYFDRAARLLEQTLLMPHIAADIRERAKQHYMRAFKKSGLPVKLVERIRLAEAEPNQGNAILLKQKLVYALENNGLYYEAGLIEEQIGDNHGAIRLFVKGNRHHDALRAAENTGVSHIVRDVCGEALKYYEGRGDRAYKQEEIGAEYGDALFFACTISDEQAIKRISKKVSRYDSDMELVEQVRRKLGTNAPLRTGQLR